MVVFQRPLAQNYYFYFFFCLFCLQEPVRGDADAGLVLSLFPGLVVAVSRDLIRR